MVVVSAYDAFQQQYNDDADSLDNEADLDHDDVGAAPFASGTARVSCTSLTTRSRWCISAF